MRLSQRGLELIKSFEGVRLTPYKDSGGLFTVGYGHLIGKDKTGKYVLNLTQPISQERADQYFIEDLLRFEKCVNETLTGLTSCQFDALVSLAYNIGEAAFKNSSLVRYWRDRKYTAAIREFEKWDHVNGKVVKGLLNRRLKERDYFQGKFDTTHNEPDRKTCAICEHLPIEHTTLCAAHTIGPKTPTIQKPSIIPSINKRTDDGRKPQEKK